MRFFVFTLTLLALFSPLAFNVTLGSNENLSLGVGVALVYAQDPGGLVSCSGPDCTFCSVVTSANRIIEFVITLAIVIATIILAYAGVKLVIAQGNPSALSEAKGYFLNVLIGIVVILIAWTLIDTVMKLLLNDDSGIGFWNEIDASKCGGARDPGGYDTNIETQEYELREYDVAVESEAVSTYTVQYDAGGSNGGSGGSYTGGHPGVDGVYVDGNNIDLKVNSVMQPIFFPGETNAKGETSSSLVRSGAAQRMKSMLAGPFARLQQNFGRAITINDALVKVNSTREAKGTSQHFYGHALDLSTSGMSNADKLRLYVEAKKVGFKGIGFGRNILHVDLGPECAWGYGNSTYGGRSVEVLKNESGRRECHLRGK